MDWFLFAILSAVVWGVENFFHKFAAKNGYNSNKISGLLGITASVISLCCYFIAGERLINVQFLLLIGFLNSITFFSSFITRLEALKTVSASVFFPVNRIGILLLLVVLSIFTLNEQLTTIHWLGLGVAVVAIYLLTAGQVQRGHKRKTLTRAGLVFMAASTVLGAFANYTADIAASSTGTYAFIFVSYLIGIPFSYAVDKVSQQQTKQTYAVNSGVKLYGLGVLIGTFNVVGFILFLLALQSGPLSLVGAINSFSILLTILLSILIYKEKPTMKEGIGIGLSFVALLLFKV